MKLSTLIASWIVVGVMLVAFAAVGSFAMRVMLQHATM